MADTLTPAQRRKCMASIRGRDTKPEMIVRSLVHRMGFRFRLHRRDLPGRPDLVFVGLRRVIFVHGCFWHQHPRCRFATRPTTRAGFWATKLDDNRKRDQRTTAALRRLGWRVLVVWECQIRDSERLARRMGQFLSSR